MALILGNCRLDFTIIEGHRQLGAFAEYHCFLSDVVDRESRPHPTSGEVSRVNEQDRRAIEKMREKGYKCVDGDAFLSRNTCGKKIDIFLGVTIGSGLRRVLAVECKLKVKGGKELNKMKDLCDGITGKFENVRRCLKTQDPPIENTCLVLFASSCAAQAKNLLYRIQAGNRYISSYKMLQFTSPSEFYDAIG